MLKLRKIHVNKKENTLRRKVVFLQVQQRDKRRQRIKTWQFFQWFYLCYAEYHFSYLECL